MARLLKPRLIECVDFEVSREACVATLSSELDREKAEEVETEEIGGSLSFRDAERVVAVDDPLAPLDFGSVTVARLGRLRLVPAAKLDEVEGSGQRSAMLDDDAEVRVLAVEVAAEILR